MHRRALPTDCHAHTPRAVARGVFVVVLAAACLARAAGAVPPALLVKIVMSAVAYDRSIDERFGDEVNVGVVGDSDAADKVYAVLEGYADKKLKGKPISLKKASRGDVEGDAPLDLVFFVDALGGEAGKWASICQDRGITGVSAVEADVAAGLSLGVEMTDKGKPQLLVNLSAAKAAGANFSAQVLKLARLVGDG